jgi:hypothetical protein
VSLVPSLSGEALSILTARGNIEQYSLIVEHLHHYDCDRIDVDSVPAIKYKLHTKNSRLGTLNQPVIYFGF